jgi:hypothetical protein
VIGRGEAFAGEPVTIVSDGCFPEASPKADNGTTETARRSSRGIFALACRVAAQKPVFPVRQTTPHIISTYSASRYMSAVPVHDAT